MDKIIENNFENPPIAAVSCENKSPILGKKE